jgi:hypothetical protein
MAFHIALLSSAIALTYAAPAPLFGSFLDGGSATHDTVPSRPGAGRCPNGGTWTTYSDDFNKQTSEWDIESGGEGVSYGKDGVRLDLKESMVSICVLRASHSLIGY